ncbi:MAG: NUDIX hydrolase [Chitinophagaceae bacterium]|nr:NUDIX hydrolase [Chitinophagaceae bacterium]
MKTFNSYKNPAIAVDLVVFGYHDKVLSALLLNRNEEPFKDGWTLPGSFLQMEETFRAACSRILQTKMGLSDLFLEQLYSFDDPARDPRGRVISVAYYALINPHAFNVVAGKMANDVKWFPVNKLPRLGFDHKVIFKTAVERLKAKILYYPVGFELLNDTFTMTELHELYECVLGIDIDRRNFRRKILDAGYIINTGTKRAGLKNRHPELYTFNKKLGENQFQLHIQIE